MSNKPLSEQLKYWRAERPSEWLMDEFIRDATKLEQRIAELQAENAELSAKLEASMLCIEERDDKIARLETQKYWRCEMSGFCSRCGSIICECTVDSEADRAYADGRILQYAKELENKLALAEKAIADSKEQKPEGYKFIVWNGRNRTEVMAIDYTPQYDKHYGLEEIRGKFPLFAAPVMKEKI